MKILRLLSRHVSVCLLCIAASFAPTASAAVITLSPSSSSIAVGQSLTIDFRIRGLGTTANESLSGFDLNALFDPNVLLLTGFSFDNPATSDNQLDLPEVGGFGFFGDVIASAGGIDAYAVSGNTSAVLDAGQANEFRFLSLEFTALAASAGTAIAIDLLDPNLMFLDAGGGLLDIEFSSTQALVTIGQPVQVPEPQSLLLVLLGGALALARSPRVRSLRTMAAATLMLAATAVPAAAQPGATPAPNSRPAAAPAKVQGKVSGEVVAVRGKRVQVRLSSGEQRWVSVEQGLSEADIGKKVSGTLVPKGDTVLMSELSISN